MLRSLRARGQCKVTPPSSPRLLCEVPADRPGRGGAQGSFAQEHGHRGGPAKRKNMCRSTPAFRWFPGTLFPSSRWEFGGPTRGCLKSRPAGGLSFLRLFGSGRRAAGSAAAPPPLWAGRTHVTRAGSGEAGSTEEAVEAAEEATAAGSQRPGERPAGCPLGRTAVAKEKNGGGFSGRGRRGLCGCRAPVFLPLLQGRGQPQTTGIYLSQM